jgi:hypothetical protein
LVFADVAVDQIKSGFGMGITRRRFELGGRRLCGYHIRYGTTGDEEY